MIVCPLRIDCDNTFAFECSKDGFERFNVSIFPGYRDSADLAQCFTKESFKQCISGKVIDRPVDTGPDGGWVVEVNVVGSKDDGAILRHTF